MNSRRALSLLVLLANSTRKSPGILAMLILGYLVTQDRHNGKQASNFLLVLAQSPSTSTPIQQKLEVEVNLHIRESSDPLLEFAALGTRAVGDGDVGCCRGGGSVRRGAAGGSRGAGRGFAVEE